MKSFVTLAIVAAIIIVALATDNTIYASLASNYTSIANTPIVTNTTNTNTSEATITTVTITSYTTTIVTSYIFQTYTSIQVVTLNWGVDPNLTITLIITVAVLALGIGYVLGYKTKREEVRKSKIEKPAVKLERKK